MHAALIWIIAALTIALMLCSASSLCLAQAKNPTWKKLQLTDKFYCEGAYYADFNKDGKLDIVSGPYWYEGPDFSKKHELRPVKAYDPKEYSDNFLTYVADLNADGYPDVISIPFPGRDGFWYENPQGKDEHWKAHLYGKDIGDESPMMADIDGDGKLELLCCQANAIGYLKPDPANPDQPWKFTTINKANYGIFTHGIGVADIKGDGKLCLLEAKAWWEPPGTPGQRWIKHPFTFADAACEMYSYDIDGDGLNDVVTSWHCHQYGLVWWKQVRSASGQISFQKHQIMGSKPDENDAGLKVSQLHAIDIADMNGDGLKDIVTGKRFWSHGPTGDVEPNAPAMLMWFELKRDKDKGAYFVTHAIDDNSGVGTQVCAGADLNGDSIPDVIVGNKKGTFIFLSQK